MKGNKNETVFCIAGVSLYSQINITLNAREIVSILFIFFGAINSTVGIHLLELLDHFFYYNEHMSKIDGKRLQNFLQGGEISHLNVWHTNGYYGKPLETHNYEYFWSPANVFVIFDRERALVLWFIFVRIVGSAVVPWHRFAVIFPRGGIYVIWNMVPRCTQAFDF